MDGRSRYDGHRVVPGRFGPAAAGRPRPAIAVYLTVSIDNNVSTAEARLEDFLASYYGLPGRVMRRAQANVSGPVELVADEIRSWVTAGAEHVVLRFVGDHERHLKAPISTDRSAVRDCGHE
jgi:hypothetical protein